MDDHLSSRSLHVYPDWLYVCQDKICGYRIARSDARARRQLGHALMASRRAASRASHGNNWIRSLSLLESLLRVESGRCPACRRTALVAIALPFRVGFSESSGLARQATGPKSRRVAN
jgi:hypothetical protein